MTTTAHANKKSALPLKIFTPETWAQEALANPLALLSDHAYLEKKAASNALELLNRWPEPLHPPTWVKKLAGIARDEATHLDQVVLIIKRRGGKLERLHRAGYPSDLRALVRRGKAQKELVDRLLVSSLIEARSCERFMILGKQAPDQDLRRFYQSLCASEWGHYQVFLDLAQEIFDPELVLSRWEELLVAEAEVIQRQPVGSRIHSGWTSLANSNKSHSFRDETEGRS